MLCPVRLTVFVALTCLVAPVSAVAAQDEPASRPVGRPVPISGYAPDVDRLAGEWIGGYEGSRRSGIVAFQLVAHRDTALGYVVMIPQAAPGEPPRPVTLGVHFVWAAGGLVEGRMERYADPELGIELETRFVGQILDGRLTGTYESVGVDVDTVLQSGGWWAMPKTAL